MSPKELRRPEYIVPAQGREALLGLLGGDALLAPPMVAEILQVQVGTLADWRLKRQGIPWVKIGRLVRYRRSDLEAWVEAQETAPELKGA